MANRSAGRSCHRVAELHSGVRRLEPEPGQTSHDPKLSSGNLRVRWPGDLLVVPLASDQTAMEDGNETVGEGAERLVMRLAFSPLAVVEAARTR